MAEAVPMLALSPTMTEGTIAAWKFKEGDTVKKSAVLCEVETDKAVMDYESPAAGTLLKIVVGAGGSASVGQLIAVIGAAGEDISALVAASARSAAPQPTSSAAPSPGPAVAAAPAAPSLASAQASPAPTAPRTEGVAASALSAAADSGSQPVLAPLYPRSSPLARVLAREAGIDLRVVTPSGPLGRVVKRDVEAYLSGSVSPRVLASPAASLATAAATAAPSAARVPKAQRSSLEDRIVPLTRMRATAAKRLGDSTREAPHFFLRAAVEADRLLSLRSSLNAGRDDSEKLSLNAWFVKLSASAIELNPAVNAIWRGDSIEYRRSVDIALAVALPEGLVAPVVRDCANKSIAEIEAEFRVLIAKAKTGTLKPEDYAGATFTISNLGAWGVEEFTAIINPPGSAILALGAISKEPVVREDSSGADEVVIRSMLRATLSCDHRTIDGAVGAAFLRDLKALYEEPARALL